MIITERKINKAINLLNKVKIKYVNNINVLDYSCEKYGVKNAWKVFLMTFSSVFTKKTPKKLIISLLYG